MDDFSGLDPGTPRTGRKALTLSLFLWALFLLAVGASAWLLFDVITGISGMGEFS
jgi:hypothetical protein